VNGVALIQRKFQTVLESEGVKPIEVKPGDPFDPAQHEAMTHEESEERKEGEIIAEVQKGYLFRGEVLRPALVRVAK
jgi:molecular chaperone GrpE